jgi:signal transduction histidine kinase
MRLRKKSFLIVAGTAVVLLAVLYVAGRRIILDSALQLERETVALDVTRVGAVLRFEVDRLTKSAGDWAAWDALYQFVADRNAAFAKENLTDEALATLDIGVVVLIDTAGRVVVEKALKPAGAAEPPVAGALKDLISREPGAWAVARQGRSGLLTLKEGTLLVAARPILHSDRSGPTRGTLIFAQPLEIDRLLTVARVAHLGASIRPLADPAVSFTVRAGLERATDTDPVVVLPLGFRTVSGAMLLDDIAGRPALVLEMIELRSIYVQGVRSLTYFIGALGLAVFCFGMMIAVLLERSVLSRLSRLSASVHGIGGGSDPAVRVDLSGSDEIAALGTEVNGMLARLEEAHEAVRRSRDQLEERVRERTAELETLNESLHSQIRDRIRAEDQLRRLKEELERQNSELRTVDRMKDALIGDVSHELRTPVAKQAMQLELLRDELERRGLAGELCGPLQVMDGALRRQQSVIRNILTLSRMEAGGRGLHLGAVRLDELIGEVVEDYRVTLASCGIAVRVDVAPVRLQSDRELLWHVFSNLVSNAVKYRGVIDPRLDVTSAREDGRVRVRVVDNGVGFSPETRERIFERFYQESAAVEGLGLGLHIVQTILGKIGGTVTIESPGKDRGTVAEIVLPLEPPAS